MIRYWAGSMVVTGILEEQVMEAMELVMGMEAIMVEACLDRPSSVQAMVDIWEAVSIIIMAVSGITAVDLEGMVDLEDITIDGI